MTASPAPTGTLHVVATPIGNLEDITLRALRVLREVTVIAAEDTRRSAKLLAHFGIPTPMLSYHAHNWRSRLPQILARLELGHPVAVVTDAGTPGISDPGAELVAACVVRGIRVEPVPGVSAPVTAAVASGFPLEPFTILGFSPHRASDRSKWLHELSAITHTVCFFETPHRIRATLLDAGDILGERPMMVARELTKAHEELIHGHAAGLAGKLGVEKGEFTIVVGPAPAPVRESAALTDEELAVEFGRMVDSTAPRSRRDLVTALARKTGRSARDVYAALERTKLRSNDQSQGHS